jgi:hypothetical protein
MNRPCRLCYERGSSGDAWPAVRCAFQLDGVFSRDNWMCATMNTLCDVVEPNRVYNGGDCSMALWPIVEHAEGNGDEYLLLGWYKNRGATATALIVVADDPARAPQPLTLEYAELVIRQHEEHRARLAKDAAPPKVLALVEEPKP